MTTIYKIHPAIGIARVGDSPDAFFFGPELPGQGPVELDGANETVLQKYKDENGRIKRQGARFRVFAYDQAPDGTLSNPVEVPGTQISWTVHLVNRKAAWGQGVSIPGPRNPGIVGAERTKLVIDPGPKTVAGANAGPIALAGGTFKNTPVDLGALLTDGNGRLIVLGGHGKSDSVPASRPVGGNNFADNPDWYDDVGDGPVTATVTEPGQPAVTVQHPAWVVVAPPDFAPAIGGVVTLRDIATVVAVNHFGVPVPTRPSFTNDILPILSRAASLRWTHDAEEWFFISQDWQRLSQGTDPGTQDLRREIKDLLTSDLPLRDRAGSLRVTDIQRRSLNAWAAGNFVDDWQPTPPAPTLTPENLDRAPLEASVGGGFFPGIEAGRGMRNENIYMEPYRLRQDMQPGFITEEMALPWQSDFWQCSGVWWPAQRPDLAHQRSNPDASPLRWTKDIITLPTGAGAERQMVERFAKLGYIKPVTLPDGQVVHVEDERDPAFPRPSLV